MSIKAMNWAMDAGACLAEINKIKASAITVLWALADQANEGGWCNPSIKYTLTRKCGQSRNSIQSHIDVFRELGVVRTEHSYNQHGRREGLEFTLQMDPAIMLPFIAEREILRVTQVIDLLESAKSPRQQRADFLSDKMGLPIPTIRVLVDEAKRVQAGEAVADVVAENPEISTSTNFGLRPKNPGNSTSPKIGLRPENRENSTSTNFGLREPKHKLEGSLSTKNDQNSLSALKGTRALNLKLNHQAQPATDTELESVNPSINPGASPGQPDWGFVVEDDHQIDGSMIDDSSTLGGGVADTPWWERPPASRRGTSKAEPTILATPVVSKPVDSSEHASTATANTPEPAQALETPSEVYKGVDLDKLRILTPSSIRGLQLEMLRNLVDVVLVRAGDAEIRNPLKYVAKACEADAEALVKTVSDVLSAVPGTPSDAPLHEDGFIAECELHEWSLPNPTAVCPSCRANALAGDSASNPRSGMPQPGWFRTDIRVKNSAKNQRSVEVEPLDLALGEEPPF